MRWMVLLTLTLLAQFAAAQQEFPTEARARLGVLKLELKQALQSGMSAGPVAAIESCQLQAPSIAAGLSGDGWSVGRTSDRLRNNANAPSAWLLPLLEAYLGSPETGPQSVTLEDGALLYVEPIKLQGQCLACHGSTLDPEVKAELQLRYPEDRATGYQVGEFRGLFWVRKQG